MARRLVSKSAGAETSAVVSATRRMYWVCIDAWSAPEHQESDDEESTPNIKEHRHAIHLKIPAESRAQAATMVNEVFQAIMDDAVERWARR